MASPSAVPPGVNGASMRRAWVGSMMLAGLGGFAALALVGMLAQWTAQPWILGSFGATCRPATFVRDTFKATFQVNRETALTCTHTRLPTLSCR